MQANNASKAEDTLVEHEGHHVRKNLLHPTNPQWCGPVDEVDVVAPSDLRKMKIRPRHSIVDDLDSGDMPVEGN